MIARSPGVFDDHPAQDLARQADPASDPDFGSGFGLMPRPQDSIRPQIRTLGPDHPANANPDTNPDILSGLNANTDRTRTSAL